jgi:hypothetical protein
MIRPDLPLMKLPWSDDWEHESRLLQVLQAGGFQPHNIEMSMKATTAMSRAFEDSLEPLLNAFLRLLKAGLIKRRYVWINRGGSMDEGWKTFEFGGDDGENCSCQKITL